MSLNSALSIASGGLANINAQFALISQNVANASTPGYAVEVGNQQDVTSDGIPLGVQTAPATIQIDQALQASVTQQNAIVSNAQTTQTALQGIDSVLGTPGSGSDIGSLLGNLQDSFSTLLTDPSNQTEQSAVVSSATTLAQGINNLSSAYSSQRQASQNDLGSAVNTLNATLTTIGQLSNQIVALKPGNQSTADLENQRNAAVQTLSQLLDGQDRRATRRRLDGIHVQRSGLADPLDQRPVLRARCIHAARIVLSRWRHSWHYLGWSRCDQPDGGRADRR